MTKWLAGLALLFLIMTIASNIIEGAYLGGSDVGTIWGGMSAADPRSMMAGIGDMLLFNYAFFTGVWVIFRYVFICISFGIFLGLLIQMPLWLALLVGIVSAAALAGVYL